MNKLLLLFMTLTLVLAAGGSRAEQPEGATQAENQPASLGMKIKLDLSEKILAALAQGDYEALGESAKAMRALNQIEYFIRRKTPGYQTQLKVFLFATDELVRNAEEKNIDGATLAFTQMTVSCVNCHKAIRKY